MSSSLSPTPATWPTLPESARRARLLGRLLGLAAALQATGDGRGLLALGSAAETDRLDGWSDLDFFAIVADGTKARWVADPQWMAAAHPLAFAFRNTADGFKVLFADGVFGEMAVFEAHELAHIPFAPGRWVWRADDLPEALARPQVNLPTPPTRGRTEWLVGEALTNLIVGLLRWHRGEKLAAFRLVQVYAVDRLLELSALAQPSPSATPTAAAARPDPFDPTRRAEVRLTALAPHLPTLVPGYAATPAAARAILDWLAARHPVPSAVVDFIRSLATS